VRARKTLCPVCRRAFNPKRGCSHAYDRPPLPTLHLSNGALLRLHPIVKKGV
jgi:hypothetical protein